MKNELFDIANMPKYGYINRALSKISKLALVGYKCNKGAQSAYRAFFVRNISMRSHISMAKLERDTFGCAGFLCSLSTNPFQLCHPHLVVNGKALLKNEGAHYSCLKISIKLHASVSSQQTLHKSKDWLNAFL